MAELRYKNVFEEFFKIKGYIQRNEDIYSQTAKEFVQKLEQYLNSFVWARDNIDKSLYLRAGQNLSIPKMAEIMRVKVSTLQGKVQTLNYKICSQLIDGNPLTVDTLSADDETLKHYIDNIEVATLNFDYCTEFSDEILYRTQQKLNEATSTECSEEDILQVILTYAQFSQKALDSWFNRLNPSAVKYVNEKLKSGEVTDELREYKYLLSRTGYRQITPKLIEQIKESIRSGNNE